MDKKLNEVTKVTDMAYVPVIMADGSIGQIAKSDLASVVAGVIKFDNTSRQLFQGMVVYNDYVSDVDNLDYGTLTYVKDSAQNLPVASSGFVFTFGAANGYKMQVYESGSSNKVIYQRIYIYGAWKSWQRIDNFGYNSLEELAGGVAEQMGLKGLTYIGSEYKTISASGGYSFSIKSNTAIVVVYDDYYGTFNSFLVTEKGTVKSIVRSDETRFELQHDGDGSFTVRSTSGNYGAYISVLQLGK